MKNNLIIFIKNPVLGQVKTRLAQTTGDEKALEIYHYLLESTRNTVLQVSAERYLFYSDFIDETDLWNAADFHKKVQYGTSLGERMENAFRACFQRGADRVVIVGSDCPEISPALIETAFEQLEGTDFTIGPASDGGYYLLGMRTFAPWVFADIQWSTSEVLAQTMGIIQMNDKTVSLLPELSDIDTEQDWLRFTTMPMYRRPSIFQTFPTLIAAESTRHGGVSPAPYASLNLGKNTGDAPENVAENRRRFCTGLGFAPEQLAWSRQVHGAEILTVAAPGGAEGYDALISRTPGVVLAVSVADCTPVLVYDARQRAVAAIHAGWRGAVAGIVEKTLGVLRESFGTEPSDCYAYVGTCIDECSFEVGPEVGVQFDEPFKRFDTASGKYFVDLKKACAAQLQAFGVPAQQIEVSPFSTVLHHEDYFSHRLEKGVTGRMMGVIGML